MFFQIYVKCLILDEVPMPKVFDEEKVALEVRQLLIIEHESLDGELLATSPFDAAMHHAIRSLSQLLSYFVLLSEDLNMLEGGDHRQLLVLHTVAVG